MVNNKTASSPTAPYDFLYWQHLFWFKWMIQARLSYFSFADACSNDSFSQACRTIVWFTTFFRPCICRSKRRGQTPDGVWLGNNMLIVHCYSQVFVCWFLFFFCRTSDKTKAGRSLYAILGHNRFWLKPVTSFTLDCLFRVVEYLKRTRSFETVPNSFRDQ